MKILHLKIFNSANSINPKSFPQTFPVKMNPMYKCQAKGKKKNEQKKRWEREKVKEKSQEGSSTFKPPKSFALFPVSTHRIRATWNLRSTHSQVAKFLFPKKTYNVDSPPISNRFANNMAVLVFCV